MTKKNLHICFFSGDITNSGGTERVSTIIANQLVERTGHKVSIVSLTKKKEEPFFYLNPQIEKHNLFQGDVKALPRIFLIWAKLSRLVKIKDIDVLVDIDGVLEMYSLPVKWLTGVKVISWEHFGYGYNPHVNYRTYTRKMAAKWADAIITITKEDKESYEKNLDIQCPIYQIYNPIIFGDMKAKYDVNSKMIISAGRLTNEKGFDYLIKVANIVLKKYPDWTWKLLGEGEERTSLEKMIKEYSLEGKVILEGNVNNIEEYYKQAAIFVMTSRHEAFGLVLTEAKAYHIPCVSFKCKMGPQEIILDEVNGYLIDCFNVEKMAEKICLLIENQQLRTEFSERALEDTEKYSLDVVMQQWVEMFRRIEINE